MCNMECGAREWGMQRERRGVMRRFSLRKLLGWILRRFGVGLFGLIALWRRISSIEFRK